MIKATTQDAKRLSLDDPVRPEIPGRWRSKDSREMFFSGTIEEPEAVICVAYCTGIPKTVEELYDLSKRRGDIAIFYSVWAYKKRIGAGRQILFDLWDDLKERGTCRRYITMSPKTRRARLFHELNGAVCISENEITDNFEYR